MELLKGKKTYLAAGSLVLLGAGLIWAGQPSIGMLAVLQGLGLVGLGDRANRHQSEILLAIQDAGKLALDARGGGASAAASDLAKLAADSIQGMTLADLQERVTPRVLDEPQAAKWPEGYTVKDGFSVPLARALGTKPQEAAATAAMTEVGK